MQALRHFLLALQYFTRIPITGRVGQWIGYSPEQLPKALAHLPGVGLLMGLCSAIVLSGVLLALPSVPQAPAVAWIAAIASTAATLLLTGAFHEDGLADLSDGLGGSYQTQRALDIMKDSRIGAFGAIAIVMALLSKVALIAAWLQAQAHLPLAQASVQAGALLVAAHVFSRVAPLCITACMAHVGDTAQSKSKPIAAHFQMRAFMVVVLWLLLTFALLYAAAPQMSWWIGLLGALTGGAVVAWRLHVRLHGFTGDGLGASQQIGELALYLTMLACLPSASAVVA
ncbi:adenosylcobinamide-GDP ribazoletransferase [Lampropedia puyangensis]|uniref:Adenosylcobinamide-GDP ribazoletransferase n=1 Tax=Lampropedia puyangensis TaxID=1330072 RepID=A0A4S8FI19_9BURK|nr:adenosylcobinamide-GDP ribazoletransferase [Lampropedia puyangensis]THU05342.1 adenosylcobinamide-GDP ribazoletransferase [Lampropedia puyangensis]